MDINFTQYIYTHNSNTDTNYMLYSYTYVSTIRSIYKRWIEIFVILVTIYLDYIYFFISFVTRKLPLRVKRTQWISPGWCIMYSPMIVEIISYGTKKSLYFSSWPFVQYGTGRDPSIWGWKDFNIGITFEWFVICKTIGYLVNFKLRHLWK